MDFQRVLFWAPFVLPSGGSLRNWLNSVAYRRFAVHRGGTKCLPLEARGMRYMDRHILVDGKIRQALVPASLSC
jgi:hypothetical protein